jgi:hypothetical protein
MKDRDPFFGFVEIRTVNASMLVSSVEQLVALAKAEKSNVVPNGFSELWSEVEQELLRSWDAEAQQSLRSLLSMLPSAYVDRASMLRIFDGQPLLERCSFSLVAASVAQKFPEVAPEVEVARLALTQPLQASPFLAGKDEDIVALLEWIRQGKQAEKVVRPDPYAEPQELAEWMMMVADSHPCFADGVSTDMSPDDLPDEDDEEDTQQSEEDDSDLQEPDGDWMGVGSSGVNACYEEWTKSTAAARLKEYLTRELR